MTGGQRVVVTGLGAVSPLGHSVGSYWDNLKAGKSGLGPVTLTPANDELTQKVAAEVKDFEPLKHFDERRVATLDRVSQFAIVAAREAIAQSGIAFDMPLSVRTATIVGTGVGGQTTHDDSFRRVYVDKRSRVFPLTIPKLMVNAPASQVSMDCGLRGPAFAVASACASATHAIGLAFQMVRGGAVDCAVTGGAEACITFGTLRGWEAMRVMSPDVCRPFSKGRLGLILGEGAAMMVLEPLERARARGAQILGEIVGFGMSADAADLTAPDLGGMVRAMQGALDDAKLAPADVQYVNAHGTGTAANDETETKALHQSFGAHAQKLAISSTKSMVGHALGAAGALELVATLLSVRDGIVPPTIGYLEPDPACDLDYVPNQARALSIDAAVSNSFAFGGLNAVLAVKRFA
ncbi:MAG TPA: beta-ketoacyl-[acyl-carrier-protein] synthase family protein [Xanthobacteraceae bacterium]|nr:beta-ketoacyl-[acyl-carrier-protein] synthase family protein [Xanthobacteraceae bacterium]